MSLISTWGGKPVKRSCGGYVKAGMNNYVSSIIIFIFYITIVFYY